MEVGNETALHDCRFLNEGYFKDLYSAFMEAFSDYVVPFALTEAQFRNHITLNAVDLDRTVGCVEDSKLVGFSLNGFGDWKGKRTAYDAGTGVMPSKRRQGISDAMFDLMLPRFRDEGIEQFLLEVVTTNAAAISLYNKLDFHPVRELALLQFDARLPPAPTPPDITMREIEKPDWALFERFWDGEPSWQNSVEALRRSEQKKRVIGAMSAGVCVGYIVYSSKFGRVAQIAVDKDHRRRGIGTALLLAMQAETADGFSLQVINIDKQVESAMAFFLSCGFYERLAQYEMLKAGL